MSNIALPSYALYRCYFEYKDGTTSISVGGGTKGNVAQTFDALYDLVVQTPPLERADRQMWSAWRKSLRGGLNRILAYDLSKHPPLAYPDAEASTDISAGWDGTATVTDLGASGALALSGLPASYEIKAGDPIGLIESGRYDVYEAIADATANGSGAVTVSVAPFLRTDIFSTSAVADLWKPRATFILDWQSWQEDAVVEQTPISFRASQVVY